MVTNANRRVLELTAEFGDLPYYSWPGGYPFYYVDSEFNTLCGTCANNNDEYSYILVDYDVNLESTDLYCDHCGQQIESAYGDGNDD